MTDKDFGFNRDPFTNEGMTGDLATVSNFGPFLDFDERPYTRVVVNLAAVKIHKCVNRNVATEFYVGRNALGVSHLTVQADTNPAGAGSP